VGGAVFDPNAPEGGGGDGGKGGTASTAAAVAAGAAAAGAPYSARASLSRKACVLGYSHSRNVAEAAGCPSAAPLGGDSAGHAWHPACVACWRSSADGSRVRSGASASFGNRAADAVLPGLVRLGSGCCFDIYYA
jgi:hypothetical protein